VSAVVGALLLGSRNAIYGVAVAPWLPGSVKYRIAAAQFTIDETTGMTLLQNSPERKKRAFWVTAASIYGFWNVGTLIGALVGNSFDTQKYGLDVAFPAAFVAMVAPLLATRKAQLAGIGGAVVCLATTPFVPMSWTVVLVLSLGAFLLKVFGFVIIGDRRFPPQVEAVIALIPAALLCALIMKDTFTAGHDLQIDARAVGLVVAVLGVWRKVPIWLVIVLACVATGITRAIS
jgi:predicted branched-subunit amino acid permease